MSRKQQAWDYQDTDTPKSWEAFQIYRDMGRNRTLRKVAQELDKSLTQMSKWSEPYNWPERVHAYDLYLDDKAHKANEAEYLKRRIQAKMNVLDMADFGLNLSGRVGTRIGKIKQPSTKAVNGALVVMNKAAEEYRKAYDDQPTNRTEIIDRRLLKETIDAIRKMGQEPEEVFRRLVDAANAEVD